MGQRKAVLLFAALSVALVGLAGSARAQDAARGKELFAMCAHCHGAAAAGDQMTLAPAIAGLDAWYIETQLGKFRDNERAAHFDDIAGMRMRGMAKWLRTPEDIKSVALYVSSLPKVTPAPTLTGGDASKGAALYAPCSGCHGVKGEGLQAVGAPPLTHTSDWYIRTQIKNYQQGIRGSDPRDVGGAAMRPMSMVLADEQAIKDVLAHLATLGGASGGSE
jgi:cytochrome c oxidase subunit 2